MGVCVRAHAHVYARSRKRKRGVGRENSRNRAPPCSLQICSVFKKFLLCAQSLSVSLCLSQDWSFRESLPSQHTSIGLFRTPTQPVKIRYSTDSLCARTWRAFWLQTSTWHQDYSKGSSVGCFRLQQAWPPIPYVSMAPAANSEGSSVWSLHLQQAWPPIRTRPQGSPTLGEKSSFGSPKRMLPAWNLVYLVLCASHGPQ